MELQFTSSRATDVIGAGSFSTTTETIHGLFRLESDRLVVQWRRQRATEHYGSEIRSDASIEEVQATELAIAAIAGVQLHRPWWRWWGGPDLILTARDLRAFEPILAPGSLHLDHPGQLRVRIHRRDQDHAVLFASDLNVACSDRALHEAIHTSSRRALP